MKIAKDSRRSSSRSNLDCYLTEIDEAPLLAAADEKELARRIADGDVEARDTMARSNLRLVVNVARQYVGRGLQFEDLVAEGNVGLMRAVEGFDPTLNTRFSTYATFWIKQSIRGALNRTGRVVRLPHYVGNLVANWRRASAVMQEEIGRAPTPEEVADRLGISRRRTRIVERALRVYQSGQADDRDDDSPGMADQLADNRSSAPDDRMANAEEMKLALASLNKMGEREATVLKLRFGLDDGAPRTLQEIGERLNCTRERVRQIERDALARLRESLGTN